MIRGEIKEPHRELDDRRGGAETWGERAQGKKWRILSCCSHMKSVWHFYFVDLS